MEVAYEVFLILPVRQKKFRSNKQILWSSNPFRRYYWQQGYHFYDYGSLFEG